MAYTDPNGNSDLWYDGSTTTLVGYSSYTNIDINSQSFWDSTQPNGYLLPTTVTYTYNTPRTYYTLIGF